MTSREQSDFKDCPCPFPPSFSLVHCIIAAGILLGIRWLGGGGRGRVFYVDSVSCPCYLFYSLHMCTSCAAMPLLLIFKIPMEHSQ